MGAKDGVSLKWSSTESGTRSFELKIICGVSSLVGVATSGTAPVVQWENPSVCDGPIGGGGADPGNGPGTPDGSLEWGALTLIALTVSGVLYVGAGSYRNKQAGAEGWDAIPNASFWSQLPGYVADGVYFSRMKLSTAHSSLEFVAPSGPLPSVATDGDKTGDALGRNGSKPRGGGKRKGYETLDEEAGGTSERTSLVGSDTSEPGPAVLMPKRGKGSKAKAKVKKPKPKPKPKQPPKGRPAASSALE